MDTHDAFVPLAFTACLLCAFALALASIAGDGFAVLCFATALAACLRWFATGVTAFDVSTLE